VPQNDLYSQGQQQQFQQPPPPPPPPPQTYQTQPAAQPVMMNPNGVNHSTPYRPPPISNRAQPVKYSPHQSPQPNPMYQNGLNQPETYPPQGPTYQQGRTSSWCYNGGANAAESIPNASASSGWHAGLEFWAF